MSGALEFPDSAAWFAVFYSSPQGSPISIRETDKPVDNELRKEKVDLRAEPTPVELRIEAKRRVA
jgi:hypothetical protein